MSDKNGRKGPASDVSENERGAMDSAVVVHGRRTTGEGRAAGGDGGAPRATSVTGCAACQCNTAFRCACSASCVTEAASYRQPRRWAAGGARAATSAWDVPRPSLDTVAMAEVTVGAGSEDGPGGRR
jgi:hypothetical protein